MSSYLNNGSNFGLVRTAPRVAKEANIDSFAGRKSEDTLECNEGLKKTIQEKDNLLAKIKEREQKVHDLIAAMENKKKERDKDSKVSTPVQKSKQKRIQAQNSWSWLSEESVTAEGSKKFEKGSSKRKESQFKPKKKSESDKARSDEIFKGLIK